MNYSNNITVEQNEFHTRKSCNGNRKILQQKMYPKLAEALYIIHKTAWHL